MLSWGLYEAICAAIAADPVAAELLPVEPDA